MLGTFNMQFHTNKKKSLKSHVVFQVHAPGAKWIKLDTPEEIAKWREERRRYNFLQFIHK